MRYVTPNQSLSLSLSLSVTTMAQPGETLTFPKPPAPADPYRSVTGKRPREDGGDALYGEFRGGDAPSPKRRVKSAMDIIFRIIVPSKQIGKVIGKVGSRIQKIREETKATIKIADAISRHEDRVIIISSKDSDNTISDAENALCQIASLILKDDDGNLEALKVGAGHVAANTIRLLIAGSQAGGLIGISGQNIEKLRISSGATITVLAQSQLPLCASAHESDRVVQLSGDVSAVMKALEEIGTHLRENPPKQVVQLNPTYNLAFNRPPQQYVDPTSGTTNLAADYVTLEMMVSETIVGGLIGRCGSNISRIRSESGAAIKCYGVIIAVLPANYIPIVSLFMLFHCRFMVGKVWRNIGKSILVVVLNSIVALAKQRVDEYVYSQLIQAAGAQQAIDPTAGMMTALAPFFTSGATDQVPAYPGMPRRNALVAQILRNVFGEKEMHLVYFPFGSLNNLREIEVLRKWKPSLVRFWMTYVES
ncbi:unnamed protein product [Camellia sinensis]